MRVVAAPAVLLCLVYWSVGCATPGSSAGRLSAAQAVADIDRLEGSSLNGELTSKEAVAAERKAVSETWLRGELGLLGGTASDADIAQAQAIVAEAVKRELPALADEAERLEGSLVERREPEATALVTRGHWYEALERVASWSARSRPSSASNAVKARVQALVRAAIAEAEAAAVPGAERYLFQRMRGWVDASPKTPDDADEVSSIVAVNASIGYGSSGCTDAQRLTIGSSPTGTPVEVEVRLGSCDVRVSRQSGIARTSTYSVSVERMRPEQYTVTEEQLGTERQSRKECNQVQVDLSSSGAHSYATVVKCDTKEFDVPVSRQVEVVKTRMVKVMEKEAREESYFAATLDAAASLEMSVTVRGDGQTVTLSERATRDDHDEQYSLQHGTSRSFRSDVEGELRKSFVSPLQGLTQRALAEWRKRRAATRLIASQSAKGLSRARALAVEAVVLDDALAAKAVAVTQLVMPARAFADLAGGLPRVSAAVLSGAQLKLPAPSASVANEYQRLEGRQEQLRGTEGRDMLLGLGVGLQPTPDFKAATPAFAIEFQIGWVPTFAAISHLLARVESDVQIFASKFLQADVAVRPEIGVRFGPFALSVLGAAGGRIGFNQSSLDIEEDGVFGARAYAGYGAHVSLHLGPVLLDSMLLRLHQTANVAPIMTRADGIIGIGVTDAFFIMARGRYQAQADLLKLFTVTDRFVSFTLGLLLQF